jgi:hypothetical protein
LDRDIGLARLTLCSLCSQYFGTGLGVVNGKVRDHLLKPLPWWGWRPAGDSFLSLMMTLECNPKYPLHWALELTVSS